MGRISALTELTSLASNDYLIVLDSSANIAKKITVANAFGIPEIGWTAAGETWVYASWSSTTRIGTITVPTDATTKYYAGMRVKISQTTGGTKYGIIVAVAATLLTVFFPSGTTFNNETVTTPMYSTVKVPLGFNADPIIWSLSVDKTVTSTQASTVAGTIYNPGGHSLTVGKGAWYVEHFGAWAGGSSGSNDVYVGLSTGASTRSMREFELRHFQSGSIFSTYRSAYKLHAAETTYYATISLSTATTSVSIRGETPQTTYGGESNIIKATCAYL